MQGGVLDDPLERFPHPIRHVTHRLARGDDGGRLAQHGCSFLGPVGIVLQAGGNILRFVRGIAFAIFDGLLDALSRLPPPASR